jgi:hypothetical protein
MFESNELFDENRHNFYMIIESSLNLTSAFYKFGFLRGQLANANQGRDHVQIRLDVSYFLVIFWIFFITFQNFIWFKFY